MDRTLGAGKRPRPEPPQRHRSVDDTGCVRKVPAFEHRRTSVGGRPTAANAGVCREFARGAASVDKIQRVTTKCIATARGEDAPWHCVEAMMSVEAPLSPHVVTAYLHRCNGNVNPDRARLLLAQLSTAGCPADAGTYGMLVAAAAKRDLAQAKHWFDEASREGLRRPQARPDARMWCNLVIAHIYAGQGGCALECFERWRAAAGGQRELHPDDEQYRAMIEACQRNGDTPLARRLFAFLQHDAEERRDLLVDSRAYIAIGRACIAGGDLEGALHYHEERRQACARRPELRLDKVDYHVLLAAFAKRGDVGAARRLFDELEFDARTRPDLRPEGAVYEVMISAHAHADPADPAGARHWFDKMAQAQIAPGERAYSNLILAHIKAGAVGEACRWMEKMKETCRPSDVTFDILISGCAEAGETELAERYCSEMNLAGWSPNHASRSHLVTAWAAKFEVAKAAEHLQEMIREADRDPVGNREFEPHMRLYGQLLYACAKTGRFREAIRWFDVAASRSADGRTGGQFLGIHYASVVAACENGGDFEEADGFARKWRCAYEANPLLSPDPAAFELLADAAARGPNPARAFVWDERMRAAGVARTDKVYGALIRAAGTGGRPRLAVDLFREMPAPSPRIYISLIDACQDDPATDFGADILRWGVASGVFDEKLGLVREMSADGTEIRMLDFHMKSILARPMEDWVGRPSGASSAMARAMFRLHADDLDDTVQFIVGQHGDGTVRDTVAQCMRDAEMNPAFLPHNRGVLIHVAATQATP
ncbi:hypothetical protein [Ramlibacter sp.]|uniref:hypothetical protein n=1 Tax=Ramlibacter sp. TaxID=1917967 RepID=UPI002D7EB5FB|nr:hypothetical protein [Ramlibacter sp.]